MSDFLLIGFTGLAGAGKTSAARHLINHGFVRHRFAEPVKSMLVTFGLTREEVDGTLKEVPSETLGGLTPRYAMDTLGTGWGRRMIGETCWVDAWGRSFPKASKVVADDVRFPNEYDALRSKGGIIINIYRPGLAAQNYESESYKLPYDYQIQNTHLPDLYRNLDAILRMLNA